MTLRIILPLLTILFLSGCSMMDHSSHNMVMNDPQTMTHGDHVMGDPTQRGIDFSRDTKDLPEVQPTETVELKDGDQFTLTASIVKKNINGKEVKMLAYNGSIPGPILKVPQNANIQLTLVNNTDTKTLLHSHGIRMQNAFDGSYPIQNHIFPGQSFEYTLKFPDAGIYWYHPHFREDYAKELGLYGNYFVIPSDPNFFSPVNREEFLTVDDILLDQSGDIVPFDKGSADHALMGRFGNTFLLNGETAYRLNVNSGEVVRFYITNTANTRTFNLTFGGAKMKLVGSDGGKYEQEEWQEEILLSPSERAIVEVLFDKPGKLALTHITPTKEYGLGEIMVNETKADQSYISEFNTLRKNTDVQSEIDPYRQYFEKNPDKTLRLAVDMGMGGGMMMDHGGAEKIEWEDTMGHMNTMSTSDSLTWEMIDEETKKSNEDIRWTFKQGDLVKMRLHNDPESMHPMQHPIHIHGQRFLVLSTNGEKHTNLVWKDTALVQSGDTVDILVEMSNPGKWMIHCHISEHMESNMMFDFAVI